MANIWLYKYNWRALIGSCFVIRSSGRQFYRDCVSWHDWNVSGTTKQTGFFVFEPSPRNSSMPDLPGGRSSKHYDWLMPCFVLRVSFTDWIGLSYYSSTPSSLLEFRYERTKYERPRVPFFYQEVVPFCEMTSFCWIPHWSRWRHSSEICCRPAPISPGDASPKWSVTGSASQNSVMTHAESWWIDDEWWIDWWNNDEWWMKCWNSAESMLKQWWNSV